MHTLKHTLWKNYVYYITHFCFLHRRREQLEKKMKAKAKFKGSHVADMCISYYTEKVPLNLGALKVNVTCATFWGVFQATRAIRE